MLLHKAVNEFNALQRGTTPQRDEHQAQEAVFKGFVGKSLIIEYIAKLSEHSSQNKVVVEIGEKPPFFYTALEKEEVGISSHSMFTIEVFE